MSNIICYKAIIIVLSFTDAYMNRLRTDRRCDVIAALVEGVSINSTFRMTGVAKHF